MAVYGICDHWLDGSCSKTKPISKDLINSFKFPCRSGYNCENHWCMAKHPTDWQRPIPDYCRFEHPEWKDQMCSSDLKCTTNHFCVFQHSESWERPLFIPCKLAEDCNDARCMDRHRAALCKNGLRCTDRTCILRHPGRKRPECKYFNAPGGCKWGEFLCRGLHINRNSYAPKMTSRHLQVTSPATSITSGNSTPRSGNEVLVVTQPVPEKKTPEVIVNSDKDKIRELEALLATGHRMLCETEIQLRSQITTLQTRNSQMDNQIAQLRAENIGYAAIIKFLKADFPPAAAGAQ